MSTNTQKLAGKVAIVTGASKGIGASIAKHLAAEGAAVVVNYAASKSGADQVVADITGAGGKAVAVQGDIAKKADIERLFSETKKAYGRLDVLVNNAGIYEFSPLEQVTEEHFHKQFNLNVLGLILSTKEALKYFSPAGGSVINISSVAGVHPVATAAVYSATKGAVDAVTKALSKELRWAKHSREFAEPGHAWKLKACTHQALWDRIFINSLPRQRLWDASVSRRTLAKWRHSWRRMIPAGSRVKSFWSRVGNTNSAFDTLNALICL